MNTLSNLNLLLVKETRAGEQRVALIPSDIKQLVENHYCVFVEHDAGKTAGFSDQAYQAAGAEIRYLIGENLNAYQQLMENIDIIVRAKRPERTREKLENKSIEKNTIMIGALDPLEKESQHIEEYHQAGIKAYSIDQLSLPTDDPMNILSAMSKMAGYLALQDAIQQAKTKNKVVIVGFGTVGSAAFEEALKQNLSAIVILTNKEQAEKIQQQGAKTILLNRQDTLEKQQQSIFDVLLDADIVITSARRANEQAPLLIPASTLAKMKKGAVVVDMALSEGGNVEGSEHDATHVLGNEVIVTNTSGYPKALPKQASKLWSQASLFFILKLQEGAVSLLPC